MKWKNIPPAILLSIAAVIVIFLYAVAFTTPYANAEVEIVAVTASSDLDSDCRISIFSAPVVFSVELAREYEVPCTTASGPLELDLSGTPLCVLYLCEFSLDSQGRFENLNLERVVNVALNSPGHEGWRAFVKITTPAG